MFDINWTSIASWAEKIAEGAQALAPLAGIAGPEGTAVDNIISKGAGTVSAIASAAQQGIPALGAISSDDLQTINNADAAMQAIDRQDASDIAAS